MKVKYICLGSPDINVTSMGRKFKYQEEFVVESDDLTDEFKEMVDMGLFRLITSRMGSIRQITQGLTKFFRRDNSGQATQAIDPGLNRALESIVGQAVKNALSEELPKYITGQGQPLASTKKDPVKTSVVDDSDSKQSTLFIRPDEQEVKVNAEVKGQTDHDDSVSGAIDALKKGKKANGK